MSVDNENITGFELYPSHTRSHEELKGSKMNDRFIPRRKDDRDVSRLKLTEKVPDTPYHKLLRGVMFPTTINDDNILSLSKTSIVPKGNMNLMDIYSQNKTKQPNTPLRLISQQPERIFEAPSLIVILFNQKIG